MHDLISVGAYAKKRENLHENAEEGMEIAPFTSINQIVNYVVLIKDGSIVSNT